MQVEQRTLNTAAHPFQITAYWLDQISDFETAVDYPIMIICREVALLIILGGKKRQLQPG